MTPPVRPNPPDQDDIRTWIPVKRQILAQLGTDEWSGPYEIKLSQRDDGYVDMILRRTPCLTI